MSGNAQNFEVFIDKLPPFISSISDEVYCLHSCFQQICDKYIVILLNMSKIILLLHVKIFTSYLKGAHNSYFQSRLDAAVHQSQNLHHWNTPIILKINKYHSSNVSTVASFKSNKRDPNNLLDPWHHAPRL